MIFFRDDLRRHIGGSPTKCINSIRWYWLKTKAEVNKFELFVSIEENVLGFDISMDNIALMQILESLSDSFEYLLCLLLLKSMLRLWQEVIIQWVSASVLLDKEDLAGALYGINKSSNHWMFELC